MVSDRCIIDEDSFDWNLARRQPMTRAKPGEFAQNYANWLSLLCPACALRNLVQSQQHARQWRQIVCTGMPPQLRQSGNQSFTLNKVTYCIHYIWFRLVGFPNKLVIVCCLFIVLLLVATIQTMIQTGHRLIRSPHKYGYNPRSVGYSLLDLYEVVIGLLGAASVVNTLE